MDNFKFAREILNAFSVEKIVSIINRYKSMGIDDSHCQRVYTKVLLAASPEPLSALERAERFSDIIAEVSGVVIEYLDTSLESVAKAFSNEVNDYIINFTTAMYKCEDKTPFSA